MINIDPPSTAPALRLVSSINRSALTRFLKRACAALGLAGTVSVLLTSDVELRRLNRTYRRKNRSTDVLSFPASPIPGLPAAHQHAGDLAVSLETAGRQAASFGHPLETEIRILLLHGLLHLSGLDHETDAGEMAVREAELRTELRLPTSLIARTEAPPLTRKQAPPSRAKPERSRGAAKRTPKFPRTGGESLTSGKQGSTGRRRVVRGRP